MTTITTRRVPLKSSLTLEQQGVSPLLARLFAARGIQQASELDHQLSALIPPTQLRGAEAAAQLLADAIIAGQRLLIIADYDCDGATACAVGMRALRSFGATPDFLVPNRFTYGYGLTPEIVRLAAERKPDLLITVDNGIASVAGVAEAKKLGIRTLITDHHLPGDTLPEADVIVNPNQPGCHFPSKALAGVGVMFYVMLALRAELRRRGHFGQRPEPNLGALLDLVALGTVADVVPLDHNNRILVAQGLARMREGRMHPGIMALFNVSGRHAQTATTTDIGFGLGPRLNAAGRLSDMSIGIECLITDDSARALNIAQQLDHFNRERRSIEAEMQDEALQHLEALVSDEPPRASIALFDPHWHQGVIGILAARIKERQHRPTFAFARGNDGEIKGSGRSIPSLHLRDALDLVAKQQPDLLLRFGGHAAAAGVTLREHDFPRFAASFEAVVHSLLTPADLTRTLETDGALETAYMSLESVRQLSAQIWGQSFPPPLFSDEFRVEKQRILKEKHLKLTLEKNGVRFEAIQFNHAEPAPERIHAVYKLDINEYMGNASVQLLLEHFEAA